MKNSSAILSARPRKPQWIESSQHEGPSYIFHNKRTKRYLKGNDSLNAILNLCTGEYSVLEIADYFASSFPDAPNVADEVVASLEEAAEAGMILLDGGLAALEYTGKRVRELTLSDGLINELDKLKEFIFRELQMNQAQDIQSDLEERLGLAALSNAKQADADSAKNHKDSTVISYGKAREVPLIAKSIRAIAREVRPQIPEIESDLEVSGNAIYQRGAHMGWHSNHSRSDGRVYCSWSEREDENFFRYEDPLTGEVVTVFERQGWNIKSFTIPPHPHRFWHCVGAQSQRLSLGFRYNLPETIAS